MLRTLTSESTETAVEVELPVPGATEVVEAATTEAAIAEVHARLGPDARILDARRVLRGGIGGFFAKEQVQLHAAPAHGRAGLGASSMSMPSGASGPAASGPAAPSLNASGPAASGLAASGLAASGPVASAPAAGGRRPGSNPWAAVADAPSAPGSPVDRLLAEVDRIRDTGASINGAAEPAAAAPSLDAPAPQAPAGHAPAAQVPAAESPAADAPAASNAAAGAAGLGTTDQGPATRGIDAQEAVDFATFLRAQLAGRTRPDVDDIDRVVAAGIAGTPVPQVPAARATLDEVAVTFDEPMTATPLPANELTPMAWPTLAPEDRHAPVTTAPSSPPPVAPSGPTADVAPAVPAAPVTAPVTAVAPPTPAAPSTPAAPAAPAPLAPTAPNDGPPASRDGGPAWSSGALLGLGLPVELVRTLEVAAPHDDVAWTMALAEALRPSCRPLPDGESVFVGPHASSFAALDGGSVARSDAWLAALGRQRWIHLVVGGTDWRRSLDKEPLAASWATVRDLPDAIRCAVELGLVLGYGPVRGRLERARPLDVALTIRDLVADR